MLMGGRFVAGLAIGMLSMIGEYCVPPLLCPLLSTFDEDWLRLTTSSVVIFVLPLVSSPLPG